MIENDQSDNQIIDMILTILFMAPGGTKYIADVCEELRLDETAYIAVVDKLEAERLATPKDPRQHMTITNFGRQVCKDGGWLVYVNIQRKQKEEEDSKNRLVSEKLQHDIKISRFQAKSLPWVFAFSVWGVLSGPISISLLLLDKCSKTPTESNMKKQPLIKTASPDSTKKTFNDEKSEAIIPNVLKADTLPIKK